MWVQLATLPTKESVGHEMGQAMEQDWEAILDAQGAPGGDAADAAYDLEYAESDFGSKSVVSSSAPSTISLATRGLTSCTNRTTCAHLQGPGRSSSCR